MWLSHTKRDMKFEYYFREARAGATAPSERVISQQRNTTRTQENDIQNLAQLYESEF